MALIMALMTLLVVKKKRRMGFGRSLRMVMRMMVEEMRGITVAGRITNICGSEIKLSAPVQKVT